MFEGLDRFCRAAQELTTANGGLRDRLYQAGVHLAVAVTRPNEWPVGLLEQAQSIDRELSKKDGSILNTLDQMDELTMAQLGRRIADLAVQLRQTVIEGNNQ